MRIASVMLALSTTSLAMAAEPTLQEVSKKMVELMESTEVSMQDGLDVPSAEFKSDGNPNTLEIVMLKSKKDGPSRVSEDGEVIFLYKASDKKQQELITEAFTIRAKRALAN
jgi:hypothetical protein